MRSGSEPGGRRARALDALGAGLWLGLAQVSLGFALLAGAGASATVFFALTTAWLAGGAVGAWAGAGRGGRAGGALALGLAGLGLAGRMLSAHPFAPWATAGGLLAGALAGAYGGAFFRSRAPRWERAAGLLFWENNGFVLGWALGTAGLFYDPGAVRAAALALGAALLVAEYARPRPLR